MAHRTAVASLVSVVLISAINATAQNTTPVRVNGNEQQKKLIKQKSPEYPAEAKFAGIDGTMVLEALIDTDGTVQSLKVITGHPVFYEAAINAVKKWRYMPGPTPVITTITMKFGLSKESQEGQTPPPDPLGSVRIEGSEQQKKFIKQIIPKYPPELIKVGIGGDVHMEAVIDKSGKVISVKVISGHEFLWKAAIGAVMQWRYKPTLLNGSPVGVLTDITVTVSKSQ